MVFPKSCLTLCAFLILFSTLSLAEKTSLENDQQSRTGKQFSLFSVVTFPNDQCSGKSSTSSSSVLGTCFSSSECTSKGGSMDGSCASGFGVCCVFTVNTCGATVTNNCTYIQNPAYPSSESSGSCSFSVQPLNSDICQLRLDFDNFDLTETSTNVGTCVDTFDVTSGSSRDYFSLCGTLTGQHMYMETGRKTTDQTLSFTIATTSTVATWRIKVNQISCFSLSKAPNDCLQYHTGVSGEISSLNYPTGLLTDIMYSICIRREHGYCGAEWALEASTSPDSFVLDATITGTSYTAAAAHVTAGDAYITIPGAYAGIYGGGILSDETVIVDTTSGTVQTYGVPLRVNLNTYGVDSATTIGFNLVYNQTPCGANINSENAE